MRILVFGLLGVIGCGGMATGPDGGTPSPDAGLDHSAAGLTAFVRSGGHAGWRAENAVHPSTGPHGGNVRSFVNELLYASLKAGNTTHPPGSAVVKELYGSGTTAVTGYAMDVKDSQGTWFFFEAFAPSYSNPYYYSGTTNFCASCHAAGPDFYLGLKANLP